jgi:hypothetical protein
MATASSDDVSGTQVAGATNISGGTDPINGAVATFADDIASINAAQQSALTLPDDYRVNGKGFWGKIVGGKTSDGGF